VAETTSPPGPKKVLSALACQAGITPPAGLSLPALLSIALFFLCTEVDIDYYLVRFRPGEAVTPVSCAPASFSSSCSARLKSVAQNMPREERTRQYIGRGLIPLRLVGHSLPAASCFSMIAFILERSDCIN